MTNRITTTLLALTLTTAIGACKSDSGSAGDTAVQGNTAAAVAPAAGASATATPAPASTGAFVDPNAASEAELVALGMPPQAAQLLVAGRPYNDMVAVDNKLKAQVADSAARKKLYAQLWKPIDINKASDAEILLIPGVGRRMLHEFKEYRPWKNSAHFQREIGKYVDQNEVARLERYVAFP